MTTLFINSFLAKDYTALETKLELVMIMWSIVLGAIIIDLVAGVTKAKRLGEARTSQGFKRTVTKVVQYYGLMCFAFMFDVLASIVEPLPYCTALAALFLVFIEAKSVFEKAEDKDRRKMTKEAEKLVTILENRGDVLKAIAEIIKKEEDKEKENQDETNI